jgi:hypothetical protein
LVEAVTQEMRWVLLSPRLNLQRVSPQLIQKKRIFYEKKMANTIISNNFNP